jgi:hypothetical protein
MLAFKLGVAEIVAKRKSYRQHPGFLLLDKAIVMSAQPMMVQIVEP